MFKSVYLFCDDEGIDPVAPKVFSMAQTHYKSEPCSQIIDGKAIERAVLPDGSELFFCRTSQIASALYPQIAGDLNQYFPTADFIGLVNWHAGSNAPEKIFCAHSTADVPLGIFGPTDGKVLAAILESIEIERKNSTLSDWRTLFEASHWSGTMYGRPAEELLQVKVPVFDIELGSSDDSWRNPEAQMVLVKAMAGVPSCATRPRIPALFLGGIHFEPNATENVLRDLAIEQHLPNQWLVSGKYEAVGAEVKVISAINSCRNKPEVIVYHDGLKSAYKECARRSAAELGIACLSHKKLRDPAWKSLLVSSHTKAA